MQLDHIYTRLVLLNQKKRLPPALLFTQAHPATIQKILTATLLHLFCKLGKACGTCGPCGKILKNCHPDVAFLQAQSREILVDDMRQWMKWLFVSPHESSFKVGIIAHANLLNVAASNAFLKTLEEPPSHAKLLLYTPQLSQLLPTLQSRLLHIRLPYAEHAPSDQDELPTWISDLTQLLAQRGKLTIKEVFNFSQQCSKDRTGLVYFFKVLEQHIARVFHDSSLPYGTFHSLETLYERCLQGERETLVRYGNTSLWVEHLLLAWKQAWSPCAS